MTKLDKQGKGVILMHDLQKHTAQALPTLLRRLKAGGYKVVQMKAKEQLETLPEYDAMLVKDLKVPAVSSASAQQRGADGFAIGICGRVQGARLTLHSSWPGLTRPSTSFFVAARQTWMPGTSPGMTMNVG